MWGYQPPFSVVVFRQAGQSRCDVCAVAFIFRVPVTSVSYWFFWDPDWKRKTMVSSYKQDLFMSTGSSPVPEHPSSLLHFPPLCHPLCCSARLRFVWGLLCGTWGGQADSPKSPRWISKHKTFDFVCQRMCSDTWLLNCPPRGLSERQSVQTQWSMGKSGGGGG